ncbi:hypothetical protein CBR_g20429 [Chara braunii]|uniref:Uncharacterized protein n=1 Tax=Chara braunii TaxID=69332 RepID=A0A388JUC1_CHABU|nr:hypothetical protein CBR_g20429 [Chara braunii]|eukprot:GBG61398.1 hypothetical protein CBR_g20429 [Chara braunii]
MQDSIRSLRLSILPDADAVTSVVIGSAKDCATDDGHTYVFAGFPHRDPCHFANRVGEHPWHGSGKEPTRDCGGVLAAVSESCQVDIGGDESGKGCLGLPGTAEHHPRKKRKSGPKKRNNLSANEGSRWLPGIDCQSSDGYATADDHRKRWRMRDDELELDSRDTSTLISADIEDSATSSGKAVGVVRRRRRRRRPVLAGNDCLQSIATAAADARAASGNYADPEEERRTSRSGSVGMEWEAGQGGGFCDTEVKSTGLRTGGGEDGSGKSNLLVTSPQKDQSFVYSPFQVRGLRQDEDRGCFSDDLAKRQTKTSWQFQTCAVIGSRTWRESSPDTISTIDFDRSGDLFATGGIARKIRVYSLSRVLAGQRGGCQTVSDSEGNEDEEQEKDGRSRWKKEKNGRPIASSGRESAREWDVDSADSSSGGLSCQGPCEMLSVCTPAKLSSLKWHPDYNSTVIATADYDGVITEWDITRGVAVTERQSGQRVWSIDFSRRFSGTRFSSLLASASDDGLLRLWTCNSESPTQTIHLPSGLPVCSVEFSPIPYILGASSADSNVYLYDLRKPASPLQVLDAHTKAVSYMKFMGAASLVSASIDGSVKLWDLPGQVTGSTSTHDHLSTGLASREQNTQVASASNSTPIPTMLPGRASVRTSHNSHRNMKNFVGLSTHAESGLFACGSENNEVVVYHSSHSEAVWVTSFDRQRAPPQLQSGLSEMNSLQTVPPVWWDPSKGHFVSAVCWSPKSPDAENSTLVAANSQGHIRVIRVA